MVVIPTNLDDNEIEQVQELAKEIRELLIDYVKKKEGKVKPTTAIIAFKIAQQPLLDQIVRDSNRKNGIALPSYGTMGQA
jgi:deoxyxylulose-5-phosphate synthase